MVHLLNLPWMLCKPTGSKRCIHTQVKDRKHDVPVCSSRSDIEHLSSDLSAHHITMHTSNDKPKNICSTRFFFLKKISRWKSKIDMWWAACWVFVPMVIHMQDLSVNSPKKREWRWFLFPNGEPTMSDLSAHHITMHTSKARAKAANKKGLHSSSKSSRTQVTLLTDAQQRQYAS